MSYFYLVDVVAAAAANAAAVAGNITAQYKTCFDREVCRASTYTPHSSAYRTSFNFDERFYQFSYSTTKLYKLMLYEYTVCVRVNLRNFY